MGFTALFEGFYQHHQIDGVEVFPAAEAPGQIGFGIHRRVKFIAHGTKKAKTSVDPATCNTHGIFDQVADRDLSSTR
jgi:hypothetical protein